MQQQPVMMQPRSCDIQRTLTVKPSVTLLRKIDGEDVITDGEQLDEVDDYSEETLARVEARVVEASNALVWLKQLF